MKLNVDKLLVDLLGNVIYHNEKPISVVGLLIQALTVLSDKEENMSGDARYRLYDIAQRISKDPEGVELKTEEIALIKERVGKAYQPIVVGCLYDILEGKGNARQ